MEDERTLLEKLARGDRASFDALYMRYAAKTEEFLCRMLKNRAEAEEGFDNGFYSIYRHNDLSRFTNKTVHAAVTHARKVKKVFRRKTGSA